MGVAPPRGVERDAGVLARRAQAERAGGSGGSYHTNAQRILPVTAGGAGERDPGRPVASDGTDSAGCRSATRAGSGGSCMRSALTGSASSPICMRRMRRPTSSTGARAGACCSSMRCRADDARILAGDFNLAHPALAGYGTAGRGSITSWSSTRKRRSPSAGPSSDASHMDVCSLTTHRSERLVGEASP